MSWRGDKQGGRLVCETTEGREQKQSARREKGG
jgi:hypothetical protein